MECSKNSFEQFSFILLQKKLLSRYCDYPHFIDEKTSTERVARRSKTYLVYKANI